MQEVLIADPGVPTEIYLGQPPDAGLLLRRGLHSLERPRAGRTDAALRDPDLRLLAAVDHGARVLLCTLQAPVLQIGVRHLAMKRSVTARLTFS